MEMGRTWQRRCLGLLMLGCALGMLIAGLTILSGRLIGIGFILYWLVCLLFTALAMLVAIWDARALGLRTREEQRALLEDTFNDIVSDARSKRKSTRQARPRR
jgi:hypothetical protein